MGSETNQSGYFEGDYFVRVEPNKFKLGEIVSYYGCAKIERIEINKFRVKESTLSWRFKENTDSPYYHVINLETGARNQEFNGTLQKDKLGQLLYG